MDSGCNQTSIHQSLIQQRALDTGRKVKVRCVHGDVANYPLVPVSIKFLGKIHRMEVAVNSHLKHPLILGTDWPAFTQLLGIVCADASWPTGRGQEEAAARAGEALTGQNPKLLAKWQGPFVVTRRVGELDYEVKRTDRGDACQIYHLNLLKRWNEGTSVGLATVVSNEDDLGPEAALKNHPFALVSGGDHLSPRQLTDLAQLQADFADVFSPLPGRTDLAQHHIETLPGEVARSRPYRLPEHKKNVVQEELKAMLNLGVIEESHSDWACPIVLVPKTDGSVRFCVDYRKVNAVSKFDAYPMPRVDELLDRLGAARFYSTLDLTKGYWQIPLSPLSKEKTAFTTPFGLHQFGTLPFGLVRALATFQRLMDKVLRPHSAYAAAYLDDIIIHSNDWQRHMEHLRAVLRALRVAGLTANPRKCAIGRVEVRYLGFHLGHGQVRPQIDKMAAVAACPSPKTKKEVRQFLGLAGYYRRFVHNFSDLTSPLTDL